MFWFVPTVRNVLSFDFVSLYVPRFGFQTMHLYLSCFSLTATVPLPWAERLALPAFLTGRRQAFSIRVVPAFSW